MDWFGKIVGLNWLQSYDLSTYLLQNIRQGKAKGVVGLMIHNGWICIALVAVVDPRSWKDQISNMGLGRRGLEVVLVFVQSCLFCLLLVGKVLWDS